MCFDLREHLAQENHPLGRAVLCLLVVPHRAALVERPEADLRVNFERPPLTVQCDRIIHLLDFGRDAPRLLTQPSRGFLPIDLTCLAVAACRQSCSAWCCKYAAAARLTKQFSRRLVAGS